MYDKAREMEQASRADPEEVEVKLYVKQSYFFMKVAAGKG